MVDYCQSDRVEVEEGNVCVLKKFENERPFIDEHSCLNYESLNPTRRFLFQLCVDKGRLPVRRPMGMARRSSKPEGCGKHFL